MRLLLDTHTLLWWLFGDERLPLRAREAIGEEANEVFVSAASIWEIATKHRLGKLVGVERIVLDPGGTLAAEGFASLAVTVEHGARAGGLPGPHRDPFDRMLVAQALVEGLVLVSNEEVFDAYAVARLW